jgi:hypothetical protein
LRGVLPDAAPAGQRFVTTLRATADRWLTESVDPAARRAADEHRAAWPARGTAEVGGHGRS